MPAFINSLILMFAAGASNASGEGGFTHFWNTYLNYPGFEAWRFVNLAIFVAVLVYFLRKPLSQAFKAKREAIRADLIRAEEERQAALARLTETEAKLARLDTEAASLREKAAMEADAEKRRILEQTEADTNKLRAQARQEIERLAQQTRFELRRFSAEESIRLAEEKIKAQMTEQADARLVKSNIQSIGGLS